MQMCHHRPLYNELSILKNVTGWTLVEFESESEGGVRGTVTSKMRRAAHQGPRVVRFLMGEVPLYRNKHGARAEA